MRRIRSAFLCCLVLFCALATLGSGAHAQTLGLNGTAPPAGVTVGAATAVTLNIADSAGQPTDRLALYASGAPDSQYLAWCYLNGTKTVPSSGITDAAVSQLAPATAGSYEWRLFTDNGTTLIATSGPLTVTASTAIVAANGVAAPNAASVVTGGSLVVTVTGGPGNATDLVTLAPAGSPDGTILDWRYLNNTTVAPATPVTGGTVTFTAPTTPGGYEARFFAANLAARLASSGPITVTPSPAALAINGVVPPTAVPVSGGTYVALDITNGPGNPGDWLGLFAANALDTAPLATRYLNGSSTPPVSGITTATVNFAVPTAAGSYEFRFFSSGTYARLATSTSLVVSAPTAQLSVNGVAAPTSSTALPGTQAVVSVAAGPGNLGDYVGLFAVGATDDDALDWRYLNDTGTLPASPLTTGTLHFSVPTTPGSYEFRFFMDDSYARLATSGRMVVPQTPAELGVNGVPAPTSVTVAPGSTISVTLTGGPGNPSDWIALAVQGSANGTYLAWRYLNGTSVPPEDGVTSATLTFTLPSGAATYELRLFAAGKDQLVVASAPVVASTSPSNVTIALTLPFPGTIFNAPASLTVSATAAVTGGVIQRVEFYDGETLIGTASGPPYVVTWAAPVEGLHVLTAVAVDQASAATTSAAVPVIVAPAGVTLGTLGAPIITPVGGTYTTSQQVEITAAPGTSIHYTVDGSIPNESSSIFVTPLEVTSASVVRAIAVQSGWTSSAVSSATYLFDFGTLTTPTASPGGGTYTNAQTVSLAADAGTIIRFTLDGNDPTETSTAYVAPITVTTTMTLKARAFRVDYTASDTLTAVYVIDTTAGLPSGEPSPPDPATIASPLSQVELTPFEDQVSFLHSGPTPIQQGLVPGTLQDFRVAVLRGRVFTRDGQPLPGARVKIAGRTEFGYTVTRLDGMFDLVVNGGGPVTLEYTRNGFLPVQRVVTPPWHDYAWAPDVRMVQLDTHVTTADFSVTAPAQVVRGSVQTDASGTRQATLIIPEGGVMASMTLPNGTVLPNLATLSLRATEYTVGPGGPLAMPAALPPTSAYTYAVELSADEALAANATKLAFDPPLPFYVENFLGFPVGTPIPVGTYDRALGAWLPENNGRVVRVLAVDAQGRAELDLDGSGNAANAVTLAALGITDGERERLADLYVAGQSVWRAPIAHFSPFDLNLSIRFTQNVVQQLYPPPLHPRTDRQEDRECTATGSVIGCQTQTLGEDFPIAGTPFTLVYRSNRAAGRGAMRTVEFDVTDAAPAASLRGATVTVEIGGRTYSQTYGNTPGQRVAFTWDGLDAYGRQAVGRMPVTLTVAYEYETEYVASTVERAFGRAGGEAATNVLTRLPQQLSTTATSELQGIVPHSVVANAWTLDVHHQYGPAAGVLRLGNGALRQASGVVPVVEGHPSVGTSAIVAPDGSGPVVDVGGYRRLRPGGFEDIVSTTPPLGSAYTSVAVGPDDAIYYVQAEAINEDTFSRLFVGRYAPDGTHTALADIPFGAPGECPLIISSIYTHVAVAADRTVYASLGPCLYRVLPDGQRFQMRAGVLGGYAGLAVSGDGTLYVSEAQLATSQISRMLPSGEWEVVAGTGAIGPSADGVPATSVPINSRGIAIDRSGVLYFQDESLDATGTQVFRIRKIGPDGLLSPVAGGLNLPVRDGWPAAASDVTTTDIAIGPDAALYLAGGRRIRGVGPRRSAGPAAYQFPSDDGAQIFDFDGNGRHLRTRDALTGVTLYEFAYDAEGRLIRIRDREGLDTTIERVAGVPTAIVSPFGPRTTLSVDASGDLRTITDPEAQSHGFDYAEGLMTRMTDPNGRQYEFAYTPDGRLASDDDPEGGVQTLSRTTIADGWTVTRTQSQVGATTYVTERPRTGGFRTVVTGPDGTTSASRTTLDGRKTSTAPDGTVTTVNVAPDSRFGLLAPVVEDARVRTPAGLEQVTTATRDVFLGDPDDLASVQFAMDTTTVNGRTYTSVYEPFSGTITSTSPEGRTTVTTLDALGRPSAVQVGDLTPTEFHYDAQGRLQQRVQGSRTTTFGYDSRGYLATVTDPLTRTVSFTNDAIGRALSQQFPDSRTATFRYDGNSNLQGLTPPGRPEHQFAYTGVNLLDTYTPPAVTPAAGPTGYTYDTARRPRAVTRADGQTLTFDYEPGTGRLASLTTPTATTTYGYEPGTGRLATVTAPGAGLAYAYDGALPLSETWSGSVQGDVAWTYDHDFRITNESVRGGLGVAFGYDQDGLLLSAGATTFTRAAATGLLESATVGSVGTSFGYNGFGELTSHATTVGGTPVYAATLGRDAGGRIQQQTEVLGGVTTTDVYGYDAAGRLETVTRNGTLVVTYGYDANGNRTAVTTAGGTTSATFDAQDRILTFGTRTYTHTPHGDVAGWTDSASSTTTTLTYDVQGNLRQVQQPGTTISYTVDGRNRRIGTAVNGVPVQGFLWQGQLRPVAELDGNGALVSRFVYGTRINVPEYLERGGTTYRLVTDHLGSVRLVIDTTTDQVVQALAYDPWGVVMQDTNPGFQPFGYAGGLYDYRTGLVRFGVRDYDSTIGRWLAKDPIGFGDGGNLYAYVGGDPQNQIDPLGLIRIKVGGYVIQVNKTDADPFPSNPHGHLYPGREKVNVFTGEILDGRNVVGKLPAKHLQVLQSRLKKAGMIGLVLTTLAVADAVALDCGTVGVNTQRAAAGAVGGFAGGWAGAEAGAWLGGALGTAVVPGIGTSVGALVGGVVGGVFGAGVGAEAGTFYVP